MKDKRKHHDAIDKLSSKQPICGGRITVQVAGEHLVEQIFLLIELVHCLAKPHCCQHWNFDQLHNQTIINARA